MSESSATRRYIDALITDANKGTHQAQALKEHVPAQDLLIIGAKLGRPELVSEALAGGAAATVEGSDEANASGAPAIFLTLDSAKLGRGGEQIDGLLGVKVNVQADTMGRAEVVKLLTDKGAKTTDYHLGSLPTLTAWFKDKIEGRPNEAGVKPIVDALEAAERKCAASLVSVKEGRGGLS